MSSRTRGRCEGAIRPESAEFLSQAGCRRRGRYVDAFDLGTVFHRASGAPVDLVEAHKWFNLAALSGCSRGQECRAEIALEMTAREIAEAQRQARAWLGSCSDQRRAA